MTINLVSGRITQHFWFQQDKILKDFDYGLLSDMILIDQLTMTYC